MTEPVTDIPIIVLGAGQSSRMRGKDKLMEPVDGQPLIRRQTALARSVTTGPVIVALPPVPHPRYDAFSGLDALLVEVPDASEGMNASLRRAIAALPQDALAAMVLLGDLPDLDHQDLKAVLAKVDPDSGNLVWRGATQNGDPGHPVVFSARLFDSLTKLRGDSGGREVIARVKGKVVLVPLPGQRARMDLDTPEDWANWRASRSDIR